MKNVLIDCDPGHDDAVAIVLGNQLANLTSITTVAGNTDLTNTTRNALALVELMGVTVSVHSGADKPLNGEVRDAQHVHGKSGFGGTDLGEPSVGTTSDDAVSHIIEASHTVQDLWLVAVGPLTNVALAIQADPTLGERLAGVSIMGGSTDAGNSTATAEFNIWADPEAARVVFAAGLNPIVCGLNLTRQVLTDDVFINAIRASGSTLGTFVADLYGYMHDRLDELLGMRRAALHDPCALLAVTHPELFELEEMYVDVEVNGELTRGMTVFDQRAALNKPPPNCQVATGVDADAVLQLIKDCLS